MRHVTAQVLHDRLPLAPWMAPHTWRLPGTVPIAPRDWLLRDEVFAAQMALRDRLIAERPEAVMALLPGAEAAAAELLALVLEHLRAAPFYRIGASVVARPDGVEVALDAPPLAVAGRLVQEDLLILERPEGAPEHVLTGGVLCFPSNWTLAQKLGRGLARIHLPVAAYDATVARRVQRLFDVLRPEAPLMRANLIVYGEAKLHNPRPEFARHAPEPGQPRFLRVERQVLTRLPETRAVVFSIHSYMLRAEDLGPTEREGLEAVRPGAITS